MDFDNTKEKRCMTVSMNYNKELTQESESDKKEEDESTPLNPFQSVPVIVQGIMAQSNGTEESNTCDCDDSCLHYLGSTGDLEGIKAYVRKVNDDSIFNSLDKDGRTVLHCIANFKGYANPKIAKHFTQIVINYADSRIEDKKNKLDLLRPDYQVRLRELNEKLFDFVNTCDKDGVTALYLAAKRENSELCYLLLNCNADWDIRTMRGKSPAEKVFKKVPELIVKIFDDLMTRNSEYADGHRSQVFLDFGTVMTYPSPTDRNWTKKGREGKENGPKRKKSERPGLYEELDYLSNICYTPVEQRLDILRQPLVKTFIWLKWQKIKWIMYAARLFQIAWFLVYSIFLLIVYRQDCPFPSAVRFQFQYGFDVEPVSTDSKNSSSANETNTIIVEEDLENYCRSDIGQLLVWILLGTLILDLLLFELPPIRVRIRRYWHPMKTQNFRKYFKRLLLALRILHAGKLLFLTLAFFTLFPVLKANLMEDQIDLSWNGWYILASIGIGLSWFNILTQIGKIPKLRVYIKMLTKVLQTLGLVLLLYSALIIAFAMVFCILLPGVGSYSSPLQAILKMSTFLIGEINYDETFYGEDSKSISASQGTAIIVFVVAIVILNIALLNFVIGLTVSDIQDLKQYTETWENYSILWQVFLFDTFLSRFPLCGQRIMQPLRMFPPDVYNVEPPNTPDLKMKIDLNSLPKLLQKEIHLIGLSVRKKKTVQVQNQDDSTPSDVVIYKL